MKINDKIELDIIDVNFKGQGIAKMDNTIIYVNGALKGETVLCKIIKVTKKYVSANMINIIVKANSRVEPKCRYIKECGGCDFMHTSDSLLYKKSFVKVTLEKQLHKKIKVNDVKKSTEVFNYRNKVIFSLKEKNGLLTFGFYKQNSHSLVNIDECINTKEMINEIAKSSISFINDSNLDKSMFRHMMIRQTSLNEIMVIFVLYKQIDLSSLAIYLEKKYHDVKSIYVNINNKNTNLALGNKYHLIYGSRTIKERVNNLNFSVSPQSFMQVNTKASEILYVEALKRLKPNKSEVVLDLYCGIGTLSLMLAKNAKRVIGVEIIPEAVLNAEKNAKINHINNASFITGSAEDIIKSIVEDEQIDVISLDPPRKGCDKKLLNVIVNSKINKIVYISCKTSSLGRDAAFLLENGYEIDDVTPVDLFTNTTNIECVTSFHLK